MLGPLLVTLVLMVFEVGYQGAVAAALDYAAQRAARLGITGAVSANGPVASDAQRTAAIRSTILNFGLGLLTDAQLTVTESSFSSVAAASANSSGVTSPGSGGQVVRYDLSYAQPLLTGSFAATLLNRTQFVHTTSLLVVNEQFPTN